MLTWYGKQPANNPFSPAYRIIVSGNNNHLSIYFYKKESALVILPFDTINQLPLKYPFPEKWTCISQTGAISADLLPNPPEQWLILDTAVSPEYTPAGWPLPRLFQENMENGCSINRISSSDYGNLLVISLSGKRIFLIDAAQFNTESPDSARMREKSNILIAVHADDKSAVALRSVFRPQYTIAIGTFNDSIAVYPNLLFCGSSSDMQCIFKPTRQNRIILDDYRR